MKKFTILICLFAFTLMAGSAFAGLLDTKEQKTFNEFVECYDLIFDTKDPTCAVSLMNKLQASTFDKEKVDVGNYTLEDLERMTMVVAVGFQCLDPAMQENPIMMGMCKEIGLPYNLKMDEPGYAEQALFNELNLGD